ncbi:MAG: ATP-grasp domain-containing protein [Winogradskyella sp.]|uniref:ATP-grasp domain-containing protein n=1 Tax=Winogradskyella sp. TaxID=1883156 RepID=UPI00179B87B5|nr:ATP-grasp domain-containing protein [Winogradskyella sp.]
MSLNILVTGCGGDIGQSIGKILNSHKDFNKIIGCDISDKNPSQFIYEDFFVSLPCSHPDYIKYIESVVESKKIDIVIPIAEPELRFFARINHLDKIGDAKLLTANLKALQIGFDKLETSNFLKKNNLPFPKTEVLADSNKPIEYPVLIKSRTGSGSSSIFIAQDQHDYDYLKTKYPDFIVQEALPSEGGEFTCGLFRDQHGEIRTIILKRELQGGYSGYGEVIINSEIEQLLIDIAKHLDLIGSINVQLRLSKRGPVVFEINPRFSSTVLFRHMFGFEDLVWTLQTLTDKPIDNYNKVTKGRKFYKGFEEYII